MNLYTESLYSGNNTIEKGQCLILYYVSFVFGLYEMANLSLLLYMINIVDYSLF